MDRSKIFSCAECGTAYIAYPPDDAHLIATLEKPNPNEVGGSIIEVIHDCEQCHTPITLYWWVRKPSAKLG